VGPPLPLMQSSLPGKVRRSNPAWQRRVLVVGFSSMARRRLFPRARTFAGECVALGGIDFDEFVSTRFQEFDGFDGEPGEIDEGGAFVE